MQKRIASLPLALIAENISFTLYRLASSRGWTAERSCYSAALIRELGRRGIDLKAIMSNDTGAQTIHYVHVAYDEANHALLPIA